MTTGKLRNILQTDPTLDPVLAERALGALSGVWSLHGKTKTVEDWALAVHSIAPEVKAFILDVAYGKLGQKGY